MNVSPPPPALRDVVPPGYRLRMPGPAAVPERVRAALAQPVLNHRGPEFRAVLAEAGAGLRRIFGTRREVLLFGSSGTGAMEAALANVLDAGDAVLVVVHGQFGERFAAIAGGMGARVDCLEVPWGEAPDPAAIAAKVRARDYRAVVCVHNESSTGVVADVAAIGEALRETPSLFIVDSVSGVGGLDMRMDAWGIDVLVAASQKALMCPPGLAFAAISEKAERAVATARGVPRFFFDFRRMQASLAKGETPFTPPVSLVLGLREALAMIEAEGLPAVLERHRRLSAALRAGCVALGLPMFPTAPNLSPTVTAACVPAGLDGAAIVRHMHARYRTVIAGQRTKLAGRVIRFGTMGWVDAGDILTDLNHLECTLRDLGHPPPAGAGVATAARMLAQ
ncbi:MAG TPA: alanine--glyoxylate aminotransferase family protein [Xanthobacteraceae bacterium]|nr:alanine--glyoxylate aminotransferase family protein [Xanthobacteraceae bacterium]